MGSDPNLLIAVKSLNGAAKTKRKYDAVLTIEDPLFRNGLRFHSRPHPDHLVLMFEDVDVLRDDIAMPAMEHIAAAIEFGRENNSGSLLVHCKAGVARSTALALAIIADRLGKGREQEAVRYLLKIRDCAVPNLVVLDMVDGYLGREGKLKQAWMSVENSSSKYAQHRMLKSKMLANHPSLFKEPFYCLSYSAWRFRPHTLVREGVIAPNTPRP